MRVGIITLLFLSLVAVVTSQDAQCCKVHGDPHIMTFDGHTYDYMGTGTFILAQDSYNNQWMVYGTFKPCGDRSKKLTCIVGISVIYDGEQLQFLRMYRINYKGKEFQVSVGQSRRVGVMTIERLAMKYKITLGYSGVTVYWDGITVSQICLSTKCGGGVEGICGNADCNSGNEFYPAKSSTAFANSWVVKTKSDSLEPEGVLPKEKTDPCAFVGYQEKGVFEGRCSWVIELLEFASCVSQPSFNAKLFEQHCMFDSCAGLALGAGCPGNKDGNCAAVKEALVMEAVIGGMTDEEARYLYMPKPLDPACIAGLALAEDCRAQGFNVPRTWINTLGCPDNDALINMRVCP